MTLLSTSTCSMSSSRTRQLHDLVRRGLDLGSPPKAPDDALASAFALGRAHLHDANGPAIELEVDLGVRQKSRLLADVDGNRDLALRRDSHGASLLLPVRIRPISGS